MLIKKFQAASEQEALTLAKQELGKDVIITHIKSVKPKGIYKLFRKPLVEITAAVDEEKVYDRKSHPQFAEELSHNPFEVKVRPDDEAHSTAIEQKLDSLQSMLEKQLKEQIIARTQGLCTEMEGAAIAQTAYRNAIPFVILRAISDKADDSAEMDYPSFERIAAHRCAEVTRSLARQLNSCHR